jgi:hypothetical protein
VSGHGQHDEDGEEVVNEVESGHFEGVVERKKKGYVTLGCQKYPDDKERVISKKQTPKQQRPWIHEGFYTSPWSFIFPLDLFMPVKR